MLGGAVGVSSRMLNDSWGMISNGCLDGFSKTPCGNLCESCLVSCRHRVKFLLMKPPIEPTGFRLGVCRWGVVVGLATVSVLRASDEATLYAPAAPAAGVPVSTANSATQQSREEVFGKDSDWWKQGVEWAKTKSDMVDISQLNLDGKTISERLEKLGMAGLPVELQRLQMALEKKSFEDAAQSAKIIDGWLKSESVSRWVEVMRIEAEQGTAAAIAEVKEYLEGPALEEGSRKAAKVMLTYLQAMDRRDLKTAIAVILYFSVRTNDSHLNDVIGILPHVLVQELHRIDPETLQSTRDPGALLSEKELEAAVKPDLESPLSETPTARKSIVNEVMSALNRLVEWWEK